MTARTEIYTDGSFNDQTGSGGWAAAVVHARSGNQSGTSSYEMELRAIVEAAKLVEAPCTIVSDHEGIIGVAQRGLRPFMCRSVWDELYAATAGKDVQFEWRRRDQSLGQRIAHQLARAEAKSVSR